MSEETLKVWINASFPKELSQRIEQTLAPHRVTWATSLHKSNLSAGGTDPDARNADIIYGQPHPEDLIHSTTLKWVHLTTAGYTRYDNAAIASALAKRQILLTNSSTVFADPCAEHLLAFMLCQARGLPPLIVGDATTHAWMYESGRSAPVLMRGQSALLVGFGAIARRLVELLAPFQMQVSAVRRSVRGDEAVPTFTNAQIDIALRDADHVINILPAADATRSFFTAKQFAQMKPGAIFYNVGRGDTVDQEALCVALEAGHLAAAYLDVTTPEPLPPDHRLWKVRNCWISPHIAGGHRDELQANVDHFLANFRRFTSGQPLLDRVTLHPT